MRGLDIRIKLAQERIWAVIERHTCGDNGSEYTHGGTLGSYGDAWSLGYRDARRGLSGPPVIFRDEPMLLLAWNEGSDALEDELEMNACDGCNDGTGNPCHIHG